MVPERNFINTARSNIKAVTWVLLAASLMCWLLVPFQEDLGSVIFSVVLIITMYLLILFLHHHGRVYRMVEIDCCLVHLIEKIELILDDKTEVERIMA
jgi:hypothetical protein